MANSKLIVVEGAQGAGKTTVTDYIRHSMKYTNLYRLCGTSDSSPSGLKKATDMYDSLLGYVKTMENLGVNLLFDRTFFSEESYCRLGLKQYSFTNTYNRLIETFSKLDFEIFYITLYLEDTSIYEQRITRKDKAVPDYAKFKAENSINQQNIYLQMAKEIEDNHPTIKSIRIASDRDFDSVKSILREKIGF